MSRLEFAVTGEPAAQGSHAISRSTHIYDSSRKLGPWRDAVQWAACEARRLQSWERPGKDTPIEVTVMFSLAAPKRMPKGRTRPTTKPDTDKLLRAIGDALVKADVILDDAQIVRIAASKWYAPAGKPTGARITVTDEVA
jgi:Holliday junction resolvase RusA-like endonuclease